MSSFNTVTVEIDIDAADKIVIANLNSMLECLEEDLKNRKESGMAIFENDKKKDIERLKEHIKAFKMVIKYYG